MSISPHSPCAGDAPHLDASAAVSGRMRRRTVSRAAHQPLGVALHRLRWAMLVALALAWLLLPTEALAGEADTAVAGPPLVATTVDTTGVQPLGATEGADSGDEGRGATLVAVVLLVAAIGLHALYRDPR